MTPEEEAAAKAAEAAKAKKQDGFLDKLADRVVAKQAAAAATHKPPARDVKRDEILDSTISGDEDIDEFMFGTKPAPTVKPEDVKP